MQDAILKINSKEINNTNKNLGLFCRSTFILVEKII